MIRKLASTPDPATAEHLKLILGVAGITVLDIQLSPHASLAGGDTCYYVEVDDQDFEEAAAILREEGQGKWILNR